jgi:hypothetical protein
MVREFAMDRHGAVVDGANGARYGKDMDLTVQIPDEIATRLAAQGDLSRRALEAFAAEEYKHGRLTKPDLRRLFGFETSHQIDEFLTRHEVYEAYTQEDLERELEGMRRLGI